MPHSTSVTTPTPAPDFPGSFSVFPNAAPPRTGRTTRVGRITACLRVLVLAGLLLAASDVAQSADIELLGGGSVTNHGRATQAVAFEWLGGTRHWKGIAVQPDVGLTYVSARRHQRSRDFSRGTAVAAVGLRFSQLPHHLFASFQLGLAGPETPALSSAQQFTSSLGWSRNGYVILVRHISNASTRKPNLGETMLLVGIDLRT